MKRIRRILLCILMITVLCGISIVGNSVVKSENKSKEKKRTAIRRSSSVFDRSAVYGIGDRKNRLFLSVSIQQSNISPDCILLQDLLSLCIHIDYRKCSRELSQIIGFQTLLVRCSPLLHFFFRDSEFDKKQYRIKFYKNKKDSAKKVSLAGMGANSEWVLNGPYLDKTLIRNKLVYDLARELNGWAPDTRFVELFVDGEYQGVYLAVEPVTNGESRLRLSEFGLLSGETAYIVNRDRIDTGS